MSETPYRPPTGTKRLLAAAALAVCAFVAYLFVTVADRPSAPPPVAPASLPAAATAPTAPGAAGAAPLTTAAPGPASTAPSTAVAEAQSTAATVDPANELLAPMLAPPGAAEATVTIGGQARALVQNQHGVFIPRPAVEPRTTVAFEVRFPEGTPGETVVVATQHGGALDEGQPALVRALDAERRVRFAFTTGASAGVYHVTLRRGAQLRTVELWAGPPMQLAEAAP